MFYWYNVIIDNLLQLSIRLLGIYVSLFVYAAMGAKKEHRNEFGALYPFPYSNYGVGMTALAFVGALPWNVRYTSNRFSMATAAIPKNTLL
jgi:hypothetical protein